jgi:hypothetical protein
MLSKISWDKKLETIFFQPFEGLAKTLLTSI